MCAQRVRETERKFDADADFIVPDLAGVGWVARRAGPRTVRLDATYFDTEDFRLAKAGVTVRRRTGGDDAGWHAKLPVGPDTRDEIRVPLGRARTTVPAELTGLLRARLLGDRLVPVARIRTERTEWDLLDADATVLAVLSDDRVDAERVGTGQATESWRELEVELAGHADGADLLDPIGDALRAAGARSAGAASKLRRVLGERVEPARRLPMSNKPDAGELASAYLRAQLDALRGSDTGVRLDRPDSVHKFRVACRRLRSALRAFRPLLDRDRVNAVRAELKWLGSQLAPARDAEVLEEHLRDAVSAVPVENVLGPVRAGLTAHFARAVADARATTLSTLDGERYGALLGELQRLLDEPPWTRRAHEPAGTWSRKAVRKAARRLAASVAAAVDSPPGPGRDSALHQARKDAKKARYTAEAVGPVFGGKLDRWRAKVEKVQSALGAHQDAVVARAVLRELGVRAHLNGDNAFTYGLLHAGQDQRAAEAEREFARYWERLRRGSAPRWL